MFCRFAYYGLWNTALHHINIMNHANHEANFSFQTVKILSYILKSQYLNTTCSLSYNVCEWHCPPGLFQIPCYMYLQFICIMWNIHDCDHEKRALMAFFWHFHFLVKYDKTKSEEVKSDFFDSTPVKSSVFLYLILQDVSLDVMKVLPKCKIFSTVKYYDVVFRRVYNCISLIVWHVISFSS